MSKITEPMLLDSTGKEIVEKLHTQNMLLNLMAGAAMEGTTSMAEIRKIVQDRNMKQWEISSTSEM